MIETLVNLHYHLAKHNWLFPKQIFFQPVFGRECSGEGAPERKGSRKIMEGGNTKKSFQDSNKPT